VRKIEKLKSSYTEAFKERAIKKVLQRGKMVQDVGVVLNQDKYQKPCGAR